MERVALIDAHLRTWGAKKFPNPSDQATLNLPLAIEIQSFCQKLWLYIGDYLSKATSRWLPQAYTKLPSWSLFDYSGRLLQSQPYPENGIKFFDNEKLDLKARQRIPEAFLRYELLCKVYGPYSLEPEHGRNTEGLPSAWFGTRVTDLKDLDSQIFQSWGWSLLYRYDNRAADRLDMKLLCCVREYVTSLYVTLFAYQARTDSRDAWSEVFEEPIERQSVRPEWDFTPAWNHYIDCIFGLYNARLGWGKLEQLRTVHQLLHLQISDRRLPHHAHYTSSWVDPTLSLMASAGFDLLTESLQSRDTEFCKFVLDLCFEFTRQPPRIEAAALSPQSLSQIWCPSWYPSRLSRLRRQRAWALFVDGEKPGPPLPTARQLYKLFGPGGDYEDHWLMPEGPWPPEDECHEQQYICHGKGVITYHSLAGKLTRFWKR